MSINNSDNGENGGGENRVAAAKRNKHINSQYCSGMAANEPWRKYQERRNGESESENRHQARQHHRSGNVTARKQRRKWRININENGSGGLNMAASTPAYLKQQQHSSGGSVISGMKYCGMYQWRLGSESNGGISGKHQRRHL